MTRWRTRALIGLGAWAAVVGVLGAAGMRPAPLPLGGIALAITAAASVLLDLDDVAPAADWRASADVGPRWRPADVRVRSLHRDLVHARDGDLVLHRTLVAIVDDHLRAAHGIDRRTERERVVAAVGLELAAFVEAPPPGLSSPDVLSRVLASIEALR